MVLHLFPNIATNQRLSFPYKVDSLCAVSCEAGVDGFQVVAYTQNNLVEYAERLKHQICQDCLTIIPVILLGQ